MDEHSYIGSLPESWSLERLNDVADLFGRIGWQGLTSDEYQDEGPWLVTGTDFQDGKINWDTCVHISEERWEEAYQIKLQAHDLLITKDGTVGKLAIVEDLPGKASLNSGVMRIVPKSTDNYSTEFLYYVLQSDVFTEWFKDVNAGVSTIQHLYQDDFKHFIFPNPPLKEQFAIARELNRRCSICGRTVHTLEKQISTLEHYRASVIHEAVTKGLDSTISLRPSGIDWIGDIPRHWKANRLKYIAAIDANLVNPDEYSDLIEIDPENIEKNTGRLINVRTAGEVGAISAKQLFSEGQIIYSKIRPALNKVVIAPSSGLCSADMYPIKTSACTRWLLYVMRSSLFVAQTSLVSQMRVKMPKINVDELGDIWIPVPPFGEQCAIADYLDKRIKVIDSIIDTKNKQLDVLKQQRQSLIYEYVTGKRRVAQED